MPTSGCFSRVPPNQAATSEEADKAIVEAEFVLPANSPIAVFLALQEIEFERIGKDICVTGYPFYGTATIPE